METGIVPIEKFLINQKFFTLNNTIYIRNAEGQKMMVVDMPSFKMIKQLNFYASDKKENLLFYIRQDKVVFVKGSTYTLYNSNHEPLAIYMAVLLENIYKRRIRILDPKRRLICDLSEQAAEKSILGPFSKGDFLFHNGDQILGRFEVPKKGQRMFALDLPGKHSQTLDNRIALGAAIILYARVI